MVRLFVRCLRLSYLSIALASLPLVLSQFGFDSAIAADPANPVLPANLRRVNLWKLALGASKQPSPWRVAPCERPGKTPLLCVYDRQALVGTVEMGTYLLSSRADLRQALTKAGIPPKADYAAPQYRSQVAIALKAWIEDYYAFFKRDRQAAYSGKIAFVTKKPAQVSIGKMAGFRYGFSGINQATKGTHEQHLGYVAFDGVTLYVITTAFDDTSETGKFKTLEALQGFEPTLTKLIAGLQLPIATPSR